MDIRTTGSIAGMTPSRAVNILNARAHLGCTDWRLDRPFLNDVVHGCWPMQQRPDDMRIPAEEAVRLANEYLRSDRSNQDQRP